VVMPIHAQISSDTIATSCGIAVHIGSPVLALCRELVRQGCNPATPMQAFRGDTLCLTIRSIGEAAGLQVSGEGTGFRPATQPGSAPPVSLTTPSSMAA
jgi:hypothetical protein